ncbi:uncharacterized protein EV422DRAFT_605890 [Fimicolochytrium jonesii]|uniref:uncharacterized protein n=1 Tax=Fimicolochytrium jonesii TaxID=1396493 RepID=UPI0022FEDE22|nr:uncharacterized protein EV422DRAFT_605890 [Fimicolochytrium jonesii]KAI8825200.1 hypothetical protein EV422DRAFT_605890 [Fimicolochytrium jonesii]
MSDTGDYTTQDSFFVPNRYYENYEYVKSQWIAVTSLLFLWALALIARQVATYLTERSQAEATETERQALLTPETRARASGWAPRFDRAADALRNCLMMLVAATILSSIPYPYMCKMQQPLRPGLPIRPEPICGTCLSNGSTLASSILSWVFVAMTLLATILELAVSDMTSAAMARTFTGLVSFPLILTIFILAFKQWGKIHDQEQRCD